MKKKPVSNISDSEWEIMNVAWEKSPITAQEIIDRLGVRKRWNPKTIGTFLNRLVKKGVLRFKQEGRRYLFYPNIAREACVKKESRSFLERVFCGQAGSLLAHFVNDVDLSPAEISKLELILKKKGR